ncbi:dipeptidase [Eubacteriales bacterium mix99]
MNSYYVIDSHCDTVMKVADQGARLDRAGQSHVTIPGLREGRVGVQFFAAWVGPKNRYSPCLQRGLQLVDAYYGMLDRYPEDFLPVYRFQDINKAQEQHKIGCLLTVEGGDVLEGEPVNLRILYRLGVRALTLTWNFRNEIADGVMEDMALGGLSGFGHEVVREMNRLGMLVDVSHLSERGFHDVMEVSEKPIAATHSNAWSVCRHPRNLKDDQIKLLAQRKGVMGMNFYPSFLSSGGAGLSDIIHHIEYIAALAGIDVIGFGSDFDGIGETPEGIPGPEGYGGIINELLKLNYREEDVRKIACGNYLRLLREIL